MSEWYWTEQDKRQGPCSARELKEHVATGRVQPSTLVWKKGQGEWIPAGSVKSLFPANDAEPIQSDTGEPPPLPKSRSSVPVDTSAALETAKKHASAFLSDLKSLNFREEVVPLDASNLGTLLRDYVFWGVTLLGVVPLLIGTLSRPDYQLTTFALFFAVLWGVVFKYFIVRGSQTWTILLVSLFTTGVVGIFGLLTTYKFLPDTYLKLTQSPSGLVRLFGFIAQVGICEELCKALPIIGYLLWRRDRTDTSTVILIGVFSGLGFAAFENIDYGYRSIEHTYEMTRQQGSGGLILGTADAMVNVMLRSLSAVFAHAVWSGIVGYFLALAGLTRKRRGALFLVGLLTASVLHGIYDWLVMLQPTFAALVVGASFMLFYAYLSKLRALSMPPLNPNEAAE